MSVDIVVVKTAYGPMFALKNDWFVGRSLIEYGEYSVGEQDFFEVVSKQGGAAVDVGANMGAHSVFLASKFPHLYAFEAQWFMYMILKANLARHLNTTTYNAAVGGEEGILHIPAVNYELENNFGGIGKDCFGDTPPEQIAMEQVQLRMLDKVDALRKEEKISLIKIDVEGMELDVLKGAQSLIAQHRPILYVENDKPNKAPELLKFIYNLGYKAWWHITPMARFNNYRKNPKTMKETLGMDHLVSFNLICVPVDGWLTINNSIQCTPENPHVPPGCHVAGETSNNG